MLSASKSMSYESQIKKCVKIALLSAKPLSGLSHFLRYKYAYSGFYSGPQVALQIIHGSAQDEIENYVTLSRREVRDDLIGGCGKELRVLHPLVYVDAEVMKDHNGGRLNDAVMQPVLRVGAEEAAPEGEWRIFYEVRYEMHEVDIFRIDRYVHVRPVRIGVEAPVGGDAAVAVIAQILYLERELVLRSHRL